MKKIILFFTLIGLSQSLIAQWFYDNCEGGSANTSQPSPWVNSSAAANPSGIVNQGVTTVGQVGSLIWQNGWNGVSGNTTTSGTSLGWSSTSGNNGNSSVAYTYTLALTGTAQITSLTFGVRSNTAANRNFSVSINSVNQPLSVSSMPNNNWLGVTCTPTTPINLTTGTITIQVLCTGQTSSTSGGMIQRLDEMKIFGSVTPAPACTNPTAFNLTGGGSYCAGGSGVAVGLSNSETGTTYQLFNGASAVGSPVSGTGSAISFGNQTTTGTYTVVATKTSGGCTATMTGSAVVSIDSAPTAGITGTTTGCGSVSLTATGGTSYAWSNGTNTAAATFTTSGTYTVTVTGTGGCTASTSRAVTVNTAPTAGITGTTTGCGSVSLTATGGTSYAWSNGTNTAAATFTTSGTYSVTVTNAAGCTASTSANVTVNTAPTITTSASPAICVGAVSFTIPYTATTAALLLILFQEQVLQL